MKTNRHLDASTIKAGIDSRLAGLHIDDSMKASILHRIENNNVDIKVYNPKKKTTIRKMVTILIAACLCFAITIPVIGAMVPGVYTNLFNNTEPVVPEDPIITEGNDDSGYHIIIDSGIEFSVNSAYYDNANLLLSFELQDNTEQRLDADCFAYDIMVSGKSVVDYSWYDDFDPEAKILTVYMVCYDIEISDTTVMFELDTLFDTRTETAISGVYKQMHEIVRVGGQSMDPLMNVGDFVIDDFWISPLSFSLSGSGQLSTDLLYTMTVFMSDGSYHVFTGGLTYSEIGETSWEYCTETVYSIDGEILRTNNNFAVTNNFSDGLLTQKVCFYEPLDFENLSYIVLEYSETDQTFTLYP